MSKLVPNEPDHPTICHNLQWLILTKILAHELSWIVGWSGSASNFDLNFQAKQDTPSLFSPFFSSILSCYVIRLLQLTHCSLHCLLYASHGSEAHHTVMAGHFDNFKAGLAAVDRETEGVRIRYTFGNFFSRWRIWWEIGAKFVPRCVNLTQNFLNLLVFVVGLMHWSFHFVAKLLHG